MLLPRKRLLCHLRQYLHLTFSGPRKVGTHRLDWEVHAMPQKEVIYTLNMLQESERKVKSLSHVRLFATPWTVAYQAPLSTEFPRQ